MMKEKDMFGKLNKLNEARSKKETVREQLNSKINDADNNIMIEKAHIIEKICSEKGFNFADVCRFLDMITIPLDDVAVLIDRHTKMKPHSERNDTNEQ